MARLDPGSRALNRGTGPSRRAFLSCAATSALGVALTRCGGADSKPIPTGRPARVPLMTEPSTLDRARAGDRMGQVIARLISDPLVHQDQALAFTPCIARQWRYDDDGLRLTFDLRDDATWHDGRPVTSADVVYSWRTYADATLAVPEVAQLFDLVEDVAADGPHRVLVRYREPYAPGLLTWTTPLLPAHHTDRSGSPLGCGAWKFARWDRGERVVLSARTDDTRAARIGGLELEIIGGYAEQLAALEAGDLDLAPLFPEDWVTRHDDGAFLDRFEIHGYRIPYYFAISWRVQGGPDFLADARVRRAFAHAMDRQGYLDGVAHGLGTIGITSFHPDMWSFDATLAPYAFDRARAESLLDDAGWTRTGRDGARARAGQPLRFKLTYPASSAQTERIAAFFQANLKDVGVAMDLDPVEWSVYLEKTRDRSYEAVMGGRYIALDPDPYEIWHSSQAASGANFCCLRDDAIDRAIETARTTFDRRRRAEIYGALQARLHEEQPMTVLFYPESRVAVTRALRGFGCGPLGYLDFDPGPRAWSWEAQSGVATWGARRWLG